MKKITLFLVLVILISGCGEQAVEEKTGEQTQIANPASVYCGEQGGSLEIRTAGDGSQAGYCILKDGTECEEWDYYGGECPEKEEKTEIILSTNPVDKLSDSLIQKWGADCKDKKTDLEKANCILDWQEKNIFWCYTHPEETVMPKMFETGYSDCVVDMQFQQMKPGSFPLSKVMEIKMRNGKMFGACYTYAATYCAVARWNGLQCRIMATKTTIGFYSASQGDYGVGYCGATPKAYLDKLGFDCDEWRKMDWTVDADHYWAEVLIDEKWKMMEKPLWAYMRDTQKNIIDAGKSYGDTGW